MPQARVLSAVLLLPALCIVARGHAVGGAAAALFHPGAVLNDTDGRIIRAHQPHVYLENGTYHLFGSAHVGASDGAPGVVNLYTSEDCHAWTFRGGVYNHTGNARYVTFWLKHHHFDLF